MNKRFSVSIARKMLRLLGGERLPASMLPAWITDELTEEGLLCAVSHGSRRSYRVLDGSALEDYLRRRYTGGADLSRWIELTERAEWTDRGTLVRETGDSKAVRVRTFCGFLVNSCEPVGASIDGEELVVAPHPGTALFIQHPETFRIAEDVVVVGVENGENFSRIRQQRYLFEAERVLFVSRYPQSADLRRWLQQIPNRYLHFGDFDLAGIQIFLTEFYDFLGPRASFFVPADIEERLQRGNAALYDTQYARYAHCPVDDPRLARLVELIHRYRRGYEQEGYLL